jgi:hypothetical protein
MNLLAAALVAATAAVPQPGSHAFRDKSSQVDLLKPPAVIDCDPGHTYGTAVVGVRFVKASRAGSVRAQTGRVASPFQWVISETSYWLRSDIGGGWHYKLVHPRCGEANFLNYRIGRRKPGVHRVVHLRIRVRAAA